MSLFARACQVHKPFRGPFVLCLFLNFFLLDFLSDVLLNLGNNRLLANCVISSFVVFKSDLTFRTVQLFMFVRKWKGALFIETLRLDLS